ncbi:hypothetical protein L7F22_003240 [Adiantum nelumboides]|nr:hypothetical protein [Adiantum nelumboides]
MSKAAATIKNLAVGKHTPCIFQGFTGKSATFHAKLSLSIGTNIVGGVTPKKGGQLHLDRPVFDTVKEAVRQLKPHATAVFVPPMLAANAIIDAIENEIPLIVSVAEGVPLKDQMRIMSALHSQEKSRLVGCNSPGMMNPSGCRLGISPLSVAVPGPIGIASRSGTLSYEAAWSTKHMGQSNILGLGGDFYPGTRHAEAVEFFMNDEQTKGIVLVGEVGGIMEEEAAELIRNKYSGQDGKPIKPVVAFIAGRNVPPGQIFGHAGAIWRDGLSSAEQKRTALKEAGVIVVDAVGDVGQAIQKELESRGIDPVRKQE